MSTVITVILLTSLTLTSTGEAAQLTISPRPLYEEVPVTVRCSLGNIISHVDVLNSVSVSRRLLSNPSTSVMIASAITLKNGGKAVLKDVNNFRSRATVTGKSDNNDKSGSFVQIQMTGMTCSDSGEYFCAIGYNTLAGSPDTSESSVNIIILTKPGDIEMIVTPKKEFSPYVVNETVEFRCNGNVGNPVQSWSWQWKYAADIMWMSYPYTERIKDDPPRLSGCKNRGSSVLTHTVSLSDKRRMFRCIVGNNELYSVNFTINTQSEAAQLTIRPSLVDEEVPVTVRCSLGNIITKPDDIEMIVTPRKEFSPYVVNETVEFRCNGYVGNPAQSWSWQWKYAADMMWLSYPYTERIKDDPPRLSGCKNLGRSVLTHTVSLNDNTRMFRCIVGNNELYSANFTINTQTTDKLANTTTNNGYVQRADIVCTSTSMEISIPATLLPRHNATLRDPACLVRFNGTHHVIDIGLDQCGTTVEISEDSIIFRNELSAHVTNALFPPDVTFGDNGEAFIPLQCEYPRRANVSLEYLPLHHTLRIFERGFGRLDFELRQFKDNEYVTEIASDSLPAKIPLNDQLHVALSLGRSSLTNLGIFVDGCIATPMPSPNYPVFRQLIKNGCATEPEVRVDQSKSLSEFRWSFNVFRFTSTSPVSSPQLVYVHCQVSVCRPSQCAPSCHVTRRRRRGLAQRHSSHLISTGPFVVMKEQDSSNSPAAVVVSTCVAAVACVVAMVAVVAWKRNKGKGYRLVPQTPKE